MTRDPTVPRSLHGLTAAVDLTSALVTTACANRPSRPAPTPITASSAALAPTRVAPVAPKPSPQQTEVAALFENARAFSRAGNKDAAFALIARSGLARETAILYAQHAREEFSALARSTQMSLPSIAVLDAQFAVLEGDGPKALAAARFQR